MDAGNIDWGNKWIWIGLAITLALIVGGGILLSSGNGNTAPSPPATGGNEVDPPIDSAVTPPVDSTPEQVLKKYPCETRKVCKGREGYANWIKTGNQEKCNATAFQQGICATDCLGTCLAWQY